MGYLTLEFKMDNIYKQTKIMKVELTKQETSDLTLACEALMEQLYNDFTEGVLRFTHEPLQHQKERYYRLWDLSEKLNK